MDAREAFRELGLDRGASADAIRKAHKDLARDRHPDHEGDVEAMQRVNEARDVALRHLQDLATVPTQELALRQMLDLERRRVERERGQERGRELVAGAATLAIGRLRRTQRRASLLVLPTAVLAAVLGLSKTLGWTPTGPALDLFLVLAAVTAILLGLQRTILTERIGQIQLAIEDVGTALASRATYAQTFQRVADGMLAPEGFGEVELAFANRLWLSPAQPAPAPGDDEKIVAEGWGADLLARRERPEDVLVTLRHVLRRCRISGYSDQTAAAALAAWVEAGELQCYSTTSGVCFSGEQLGEMVRRRFAGSVGLGSRPDWAELVTEIGRAPRRPPRGLADRLRDLGRAATALAFPPDDAVEAKMRDLGRRIGVNETTRLFLGKGLENRLLAEREIVDGRGRLRTTYRFSLDPVTTAPEQ